jgi:CHAT domain-containing protein
MTALLISEELCDVAHNLNVDPKTHVFLGALATETRIKQLSDEGSLAKYKIIHFATHGAVAGEISHASEPELLLTPPTTQATLTTATYQRRRSPHSYSMLIG